MSTATESPTRQRVALRPPQVVEATTVMSWEPTLDASDAPLVVLAHGAGSGPESALHVAVAEALVAQGSPVASFAFAYRAAGRRAPDPPARLRSAWQDVIAEVAAAHSERRLVLGGRSMGGRIASLLVAEGQVCAGLVLLGYPLHPAGRPERLRTAHWPDLAVPLLFVSGDRDALCDREQFAHARATLPASTPVAAHVLAGADHSFTTRARAERTDHDVLADAAGIVAHWIARLPERTP